MGKRSGSPSAGGPAAKHAVASAGSEGGCQHGCGSRSGDVAGATEKEGSTDPTPAPIRIEVTKFDGESVLLDVSPEDGVASLKARLSSRFEVDGSVSVKLLCGGRVLDDDTLLVKDLPGYALQLVLTRAPVVLLKTGLTGRAKYRAGGVLAPSGLIFFAPCDACRVLRVDPSRLLAECVGPPLAGTDKYEAGGILGKDGCIYFAPRDAAKVLQIDPQAASVSYVGPELEGEDKYIAGGVLAANGCIYFAPSCAQKVLRVKPGASPGDVVVEEVGPALEGVSKYMAGGVLGGDGRIYFAPCNASRVLCVEPGADGDRVFEIGQSLPANLGDDLLGRYVAGGVLGSNGCIYFGPLRAGHVLRVDPERQEVASVGPHFACSCAYEANGVLGPDGRIYFVPYNADHVLRIDPAAPDGQEVSVMDSSAPSVKDYMGHGAVAADGCIYFAPGSHPDQVLRIDPDAQKVELFGRHLGKVRRQHLRYQSGFVRAQDGRLFCAPYDTDRVLCIQV